MLSAHTRSAARTAAVLAGLLAGALAIPHSAAAQSVLDTYIAGEMSAGHVPGLAACLINGDHVIWAKGYGWANIEEQRPATPHTLFKQGSVAKTLTATALMQLCERGLVALDDDINAYLSFPVRNPNVPPAPITLRQLLTHTSSIRDNWSVMYALLTTGDPQVPLAEFMQQYFTPGGRYYNATENFSATGPGEGFAYSNIGFALAGHLVQAIANEPFDAYFQEHFFAPLNMTESAWCYANLDLEHHAMAYHYTSGGYVPYGHLSFPDVPAGELHTSVLQMANFLIAHINAGCFAGRQVFAPATIAEMHRIQFPARWPNQALAFYRANYGGDMLLGHTGSDVGYRTACFFRPADGIGAIVLTNGESEGVCTNVLTRLFDEADLVRSRPPGDLNCDGEVNFADINPFVLALADPAGYLEQHDGDPEALCDGMLGDLNRDGQLDFDDINPFVEVLTRGQRT